MNTELSNHASNARYIVGFRTHIWNEHIEYLARKALGYSIGAEFVILADETNGPLNTGNLPKITHTSDFSSFGLPSFPADSVLWYNGDYPLYLLQSRFPNARYFCMIEYDVACNVDIYALMSQAEADQIDFIAHEIQVAEDWWYHYDRVAPHFSKVYKCLFPFLVISTESISLLLQRRRNIFATKPLKNVEDWPYCEGFIASVLAEKELPNIQDISNFASLPFFSFTNPVHIKEPEANAPGTICHPVLGGTTFIDKRFYCDDISTIFNADSPLLRQLSFCEPELFFNPLLNRIKALNSADAIQQFMVLAKRLGWIESDYVYNIALFRPALTSSTSEWSHQPDPADDAKGGNNGQLTGEYGFHTAFELDPWWQVDFENECLVAAMILYNRMNAMDRCKKISVLKSLDGTNWDIISAKLDNAPFGGIDGHPYIYKFPHPSRARFIRVHLIGEGFFHLDEIEIYGTPA